MRKASGCLVGAAALVALALFGFIWTFCRVYVPAGYMAIVTAKTGKPLPSGRKGGMQFYQTFSVPSHNIQ